MIKVPFNEAKFKQLAPDCTAEYVNYMPRGKNGMRCWRLSAKPDGEYMIVLLCDYGYKTGGEVIEIHPLLTVKNAMKKFCRLYYEKGVSQLFLANLLI